MHVSEVDRGRACRCSCAACDRAVVAKKGAHNVFHFAHDVSGSCATAAETALHRAIKQVIADGDVIAVPELVVEATAAYNGHTKSSRTVLEERRVSYNSPRLEERIADIVADAVVLVSGRDLIIEVAVTHRVDDDKRAKIARIGLSALELEAWRIPRDVDWPNLRAFVRESFSSRVWLHNLREPMQYRLAHLQALEHAKNTSLYWEALKRARLAKKTAAESARLHAESLKAEADRAVIEKFQRLWRIYKTSTLPRVKLDAKASGYVDRWNEEDAGSDPGAYFNLLLDFIRNTTASTLQAEHTENN
ncbi:competence protein CoiA family protein [Burkholderia sp. PAMC 26561]|uniref:competence protein CoiA family protein n=1 Tax=Burkholderia sp. PAMC 26561 TaxID=1795043 RepID=UPI00076AFA87|nr:competence protein CoiA family protein [Burkholderia sp. PAMC 26561]AME28578.2 hypothetical protein AXG89_32810 [Burkholderia sp. PAMC 26561]